MIYIINYQLKKPKKLVKDILVFLLFFNFYQKFIKDFSKITVLFTFILKISMTNPKKFLKTIRKNKEKEANNNVNAKINISKLKFANDKNFEI